MTETPGDNPVTNDNLILVSNLDTGVNTQPTKDLEPEDSTEKIKLLDNQSSSDSTNTVHRDSEASTTTPTIPKKKSSGCLEIFRNIMSSRKSKGSVLRTLSCVLLLIATVIGASFVFVILFNPDKNNGSNFALHSNIDCESQFKPIVDIDPETGATLYTFVRMNNEQNCPMDFKTENLGELPSQVTVFTNTDVKFSYPNTPGIDSWVVSSPESQKLVVFCNETTVWVAYFPGLYDRVDVPYLISHVDPNDLSFKVSNTMESTIMQFPQVNSFIPPKF
jgi:hypothetical protein